MRQLATTALLGALLTLTAASATASYGSEYGLVLDGTPQRFEAAVGPRSLVLQVQDITLAGDTAAQVRDYVDRQFNEDAPDASDGVVSAREIETAELALQAALNEVVRREIDFQAVTIDGYGATSVYVSGLDITGAEGSTSSTDAIRTTVEVTLMYRDVDTSLSQHQVSMKNIYADLDVSGAGETYPVAITLRSINDWSIVGSSIQPAAASDHYSGGRFTFSNGDAQLFDQQGEGLEFEIQGDPDVLDEKEDSNFLPAPAFLGAIAALGLAAKMGRRRRQ